jgi:hypothetical protein
MHIPQLLHTQRPKYNCIRVAIVAAGGHLASAPQKRPNAVVNVPVDRSISHQSRPVTEVIRESFRSPVHNSKPNDRRAPTLSFELVLTFSPRPTSFSQIALPTRPVAQTTRTIGVLLKTRSYTHLFMTTATMAVLTSSVRLIGRVPSNLVVRPGSISHHMLVYAKKNSI